MPVGMGVRSVGRAGVSMLVVRVVRVNVIVLERFVGVEMAVSLAQEQGDAGRHHRGGDRLDHAERLG